MSCSRSCFSKEEKPKKKKMKKKKEKIDKERENEREKALGKENVKQKRPVKQRVETRYCSHPDEERNTSSNVLAPKYLVLSLLLEGLSLKSCPR